MNENKPITKICSKCGRELAISKFTKNKVNKDGYRCECKECRNKYNEYLYNNSLESRARKYISSYKFKDKTKNQDFDLDIEFMINIFNSKCVYCQSEERIGCDRIDNNIGHIKSNCVPCCPYCNVARSDNFTHEEMFILGPTIRKIMELRRDKEATDKMVEQYPYYTQERLLPFWRE